MTTCNRCGMQVQISVGLAHCPNCGEPLSIAGNVGGGGPTMRTSAQDSAALPAWLESLRANERPRTSSGGQQNFSTADLIDEDALPGWMRPQSANDVSDEYAGPGRPASFPAPNTDSGMLPTPPGRLSASSLIDATALPTWMQGDQQSAAPGGLSAPQSFSASSLIDPNSLPTWMADPAQQPSRAPAPPLPPTSSAQQWGLDEMRSYQQSAPPMPAPSAPHNPGAIWGNPEPPRMFSANDLLDQQALPPWMSDLGQGQGQAAPQGPSFPPAQANPQAWPPPIENTPHVPAEAASDPSRLSAASLLDVSALPGWLREDEQKQGAPGGGTLSAGSLLDPNSLPAWLRESESQPPMGYPGTPPIHPMSPSPYGAPRVESVRVPSRPRSEIAPQEQSEVAANVFSSVLGVASTAPYYPQSGAPQQGFPGNVSPPATPLYTMPGAPGGQEPFGSAQAWPTAFPGANMGIPPAQAMQGNSQSGYLGGPSGMQPGYGNPSPMPMQPPSQGTGSTPGISAAQRSAVTMPGTRPAKRGIMDFIRDLFHINS